MENNGTQDICNERNCQKCYEFDTYALNKSTTYPELMTFAVVHCYVIFVLGSFCNAVALWCVVTCPKTRPGVKVLLCSVFLPIFLICLIVMPSIAEMFTAILTCDASRTSLTFRRVIVLLYSSLAQMELVCIAAVSVFRAVAVWSRQRRAVGLKLAVAVVVVITIYSIITAVGLLGTVVLGLVTQRSVRRVISVIYFLLNTLVPVLVTISCYVVMMLAIRRNRRRLANMQHNINTSSSVADQASRAMLAVFINNLILSLPHSVYHLLENPSHTSDVLFHIFFYTHFVADAVVLVWFNKNYRQRVVDRLRAVVGCLSPCCCSVSRPKTASSVFHLHTPSTSSINQMTSFADKQLEIVSSKLDELV